MGEVENQETAEGTEDQDLTHVELDENGDPIPVEGTVSGIDAPSLDSETKSELEKRFGTGKTDAEYTKAAFDYATNIERQDQRRANEFKDMEKLINKIGGVDILKQLAEAENPLANVPKELRGMIQSGKLDPSDPKDALLISAYRELEGLKNRSVELDVRTAVDTFESGLQDKIVSKYPDANLETIKALAYAGAFKEVPDDKFWGVIEDIAKNDQSRIEALFTKRRDGKGNLIRRNVERSILPGRRVSTDKIPSPKEAFDQAYDKLGMSDDDG